MSLPDSETRHPRARYALALLLTVNLLNYIDRQALYAVFPLIKSDLQLSDTALGFLGSAFML
jgi:sugar phosphate permease